MYLVYSVLYTIALVLTSPYWLIGMLRTQKYRAGLDERFGSVPPRLKLPAEGEDSIWVHAVSVGEVLAVSGLLAAFRKEFPATRIFVSTTTATGQKLARERFGADSVFYMPLDLPFTVNPFLRVTRPKMLVLAETEFWPNLLHLSKASNAQVAVVNARISDRSLPGYRRFRFLLRRVLKNVDFFLTQTEVDHQRLLTIGADAEKVVVTGNLKFDVKAPAESELSHSLQHVLAPDQRVLVFGSTVEAEEALLIPCFRAVLAEFSQALIVLAPRHPERFDEVAELLRSTGFSFWRRSAWRGTRISGGVLLLDTIGELASMYSLAEVAFVGGSLVPRGGHNILEPAQFGKPIMIGGHYENFREIVRAFVEHQAVKIVSPDQLTATTLALLRSPHETIQLGARAWAVVEAGRGSTQRTLAALQNLLQRNAGDEVQLSAPHA